MVSMILLAETVKQVTKIGLLMLHVRFFLKSIFMFIIFYKIFGTVTVVAPGFHLLNMFGSGILKSAGWVFVLVASPIAMSLLIPGGCKNWHVRMTVCL